MPPKTSIASGPPVCVLSVPGIRPAMFQKAAAGAADTIMLDLEDSVFAAQKPEARGHVIAALGAVDWGTKRVLVRVNGLDTEWGFLDIVALAGCPRLDGLMVPKLNSVDDLRWLERTLAQLDRGRPGSPPLELHALIESAVAVARVEAIAEAATRLNSLTFGAGDFAISLASEAAFTGTLSAGPLAFEWARTRVATACHGFGIIPVDGPFSRLDDPDGCEAEAEAGRKIGFMAKWAIHPAQIAIVARVFAPSVAAVERAHRVIAALDQALAAGTGAAQLDGRLVEAGHMAMARGIVARAAAAAARGEK